MESLKKYKKIIESNDNENISIIKSCALEFANVAQTAEDALCVLGNRGGIADQVRTIKRLRAALNLLNDKINKTLEEI